MCFQHSRERIYGPQSKKIYTDETEKKDGMFVHYILNVISNWPGKILDPI